MLKGAPHSLKGLLEIKEKGGGERKNKKGQKRGEKGKKEIKWRKNIKEK